MRKGTMTFEKQWPLWRECGDAYALETSRHKERPFASANGSGEASDGKALAMGIDNETSDGKALAMGIGNEKTEGCGNHSSLFQKAFSLG